MTVGELINELSKYHKQTRIVLNGYEGGVYDAQSARLEEIVLNVNDDWMFGDHELISEHAPEPGEKTEKAVYIS